MKPNWGNVLNSTVQGAGAGAGVGGGWGALAGGALGFLSGAIGENNQLEEQQELTQQQIDANKNLARYGSNLQYQMWRNTNYPAQVQMLKKAGLNPALMYGMGGGGGTTTGSQTTSGAVGGHAANNAEKQMARTQAMGMTLNSLRAKAEIDNLKADTAEKLANAKKTSGVDTDFTISSTNVNVANIKSIEANTRNTDLRSEGQLVTNELLKLQKLYEEGTLDARILNQTLQNNNLVANINKINAEIPWIGKIAEAQINKLKSDVKVNESEIDVNKSKKRLYDTQSDEGVSKIKLNEAQTAKIIAETGVTEEELRLFVEKGIMPKSILGSGMTAISGWIDAVARAITSDENKEGWKKLK